MVTVTDEQRAIYMLAGAVTTLTMSLTHAIGTDQMLNITMVIEGAVKQLPDEVVSELSAEWEAMNNE